MFESRDQYYCEFEKEDNYVAISMKNDVSNRYLAIFAQYDPISMLRRVLRTEESLVAAAGGLCPVAVWCLF